MDSPPAPPPSRVRLALALLLVILTAVAVWKVVDYRSQPPPPSARTPAEILR